MEATKTFRLCSALKRAMIVDEEMPLRYLVVVLHIRQRGEGVTQIEVSDTMGVTKGAISKIISKLSKWKAHGVPGLDLVYSLEDTFDRRLKKIYLTEKAKRLLAEMEKEL